MTQIDKQNELCPRQLEELSVYIFGVKYAKNIEFDFNKLNNNFKTDTNNFELIDKIYKNNKINLNNETNKNIFLRGFFDSNGNINNHNNISIYSIFEEIIKYIPTAYFYDDNLIMIKGCNSIEFLDIIYKNANYYNKDNYDKYIKIFNSGLKDTNKQFTFYKTIKNAVSPIKARITDSGFDLHIIQKISQKGNLYMYDTGIIVQPTPGIYFDLVPRSSIIKKGYMLANSIGIIDQSFIGSIKVALIKIDPDAEELELPLKIVQIIPRQVIQMNAIEVIDKNEIISTTRGDGEYGSTDKR
jgi:dUTP pyrophosphatase